MRPSKIDPATAALCERVPYAASVRDLLLDVEHAGHEAGWGNGPLMFVTLQDSESGLVKLGVDETWQNLLIGGLRVCQAHGMYPSVTNSLDLMAQQLQQIRMLADRQGDLYPHDPPWGFYGFGVRAEALMILDDEERSLTQAALKANRPGKVAERDACQEIRMIEFVGRDSLVWNLTRRRSDVPTVEARRADDPEVGGNVGNALARVTGIVADTEIYVPDAEAVVERCVQRSAQRSS